MMNITFAAESRIMEKLKERVMIDQIVVKNDWCQKSKYKMNGASAEPCTSLLTH